MRVATRLGGWRRGLVADFRIGGPNADGRGLNAANGGYGPPPGLAIVSPSADPGPSGQFRFFVRCQTPTGQWTIAPKAAGVLGSIANRVWDGSQLSYPPLGSNLGEVEAYPASPAIPSFGTHSHRLVDTAPTGWTIEEVAGVFMVGQKLTIPNGDTGDSVTKSRSPYTRHNGTAHASAIVELLSGPWPSLRLEIVRQSDGVVLHTATVDIDTLQNTDMAGSVALGTGPNGGALRECWAAIYAHSLGQTIVPRITPVLREDGAARTIVLHHLGYVDRQGWVDFYVGRPTCYVCSNGTSATKVEEYIGYSPPAVHTRVIRCKYHTAIDTSGQGLMFVPTHGHALGKQVGFRRLVSASDAVLHVFSSSRLGFETRVAYRQMVENDTHHRVSMWADGDKLTDGVLSAASIPTYSRLGNAAKMIRLERYLIWHRALADAEISSALASI